MTDTGEVDIAAGVAEAAEARAHFQRLLAVETDCWDVNAALNNGDRSFVLLDVRNPESFSLGHLPRAVNVPHRRINERNLAHYPADVVFVVYCKGPHCNGADRAALRLATLGRRVKKMIGGVEGSGMSSQLSAASFSNPPFIWMDSR